MEKRDKQRDLINKIREYIKKEDTMEINRHYCYYRAYLVKTCVRIDENLFNEVNHEYMEYFNEQYLEGKKEGSLW